MTGSHHWRVIGDSSPLGSDLMRPRFLLVGQPNPPEGGGHLVFPPASFAPGDLGSLRRSDQSGEVSTNLPLFAGNSFLNLSIRP